MATPIISISGTYDEKQAFSELAKRAYPNIHKGAQTALFRDWLYKAAKEAGIEIKDKTQYGGKRT